MTARFYIQPSKMLCRYILGLYALAAITLMQFQMALILKCTLLLWLCIYAVRFLNKWRKSAILCEYNAKKDCWQLSSGTGEWIQVTKLCAIYVSDQWAWINFHASSGMLIALLIGRDSLQATNFLQLRRSVICPAVLRSGSA